MIRILLVFLIPLAFLNYIIFQTTVSGFVSLGILGAGIVIYLLQTPKKSRWKTIVFFVISIPLLLVMMTYLR
ncbi:hypothetical protein [Alkalihalophilus marmarensis]|uniref:Uncharacterized protein n=1 Tax=Alkalihalophilus marmarensis DSM 21297 TaxID=1188261 RepID=U6SQ94_9BACI|nr:hypothetical protein [Alkalihalophilus marmarensis]ERN53854.1 hypothetical protein A33I_10265 [Alkalihalophilus marmarensis DSM 21297]